MELPDVKNKSVLILGGPASGKTTLSNKLVDQNHKIIHMDDFNKYGFENSIFECLKAIELCKVFPLVEGVQGYRLLRKGVQLDCYYPDLVIELEISEEEMVNRYKAERDVKKIKHLNSFLKSQKKIRDQYLRLSNKRPPEWILINNN